jgi:GGDEF domain-containing protein
MEAAAHLRAPAVIRLWQAIFAAGLVLLALSYIGHFSPGGTRLYETWIYEGLEVLAALGALTRAVLVRAERAAWLCIGAALLATACGDILFDFRYGGDPPFPSAADVAYLAFYPFLYVGIVLLLRRRVSTFSASLWLDGLVAATAASALAASVLVEVVVKSTHGSRLVVLTNIAYPIGDVLLLALLVFVFSVTRWRPGRAWTLIAVGLLFNTFGDGLFLYSAALGTYVEGTYLDLAWPLSLVLISLAAWQQPGRVARIQLQDRTMLGTPIVCGLVATGVLVAAANWHVHPIALGMATATIALVLARTALTLRENRRLLDDSRREALTDSLTGVANRRALLLDLPAELERASDGDEFCVLLPASEPALQRVANALNESGEGFAVTSAYGTAKLADEATTVSTALSVADQRLYAHKEALAEMRRGTAHEPLLCTLAEREPKLRAHVADV